MRENSYHGFVRNKFPDTPYTFAKGLIAKLNDVEPPVVPYETWIGVVWSQTEEQLQTHFRDCSDGGLGSLWGRMGHCYELIYWATCGLYWDNELKEQKEKGFFNGPSEFTINVWKEIDAYNYESVYDLTFKGVKWISADHFGGGGGSSDCTGIASFTYEEKIKDVNYKPMECKIPTDIKYPSLYIGALMTEYAKEKQQG